jgi:hypothetical protein
MNVTRTDKDGSVALSVCILAPCQAAGGGGSKSGRRTLRGPLAHAPSLPHTQHPPSALQYRLYDGGLTLCGLCGVPIVQGDTVVEMRSERGVCVACAGCGASQA